MPSLPTPRPGRTRRNLSADAWRERILQAARLLFAEQGYDGPSMAEIAKLAGLSRARLYRLFPGRRDLFNAVIADDGERLTELLLLELAEAEGTQASVRAMVRVFFEFVEGHHQRSRVYFTAESGVDAAVGESLRVVRNALAASFAAQLAAASDPTPHLSPDEIRIVAYGVIALAEGAAVSWLSGPHLDRDRAIQVVADTALRALQPAA